MVMRVGTVITVKNYKYIMRLQELFEALSPAAIEATSGRFGQQLMAKLAKDPQGSSMKDDPAKFIEYIANNIDPTTNSKYTKWIISRFVDPNGGIRFVEDLSKLTDPLTRYAKLTQSGRIPTDQRDINKFKSMNLLLNLMDQYAEKKTGNEEKAAEEESLIKSGQAVLYKDTGALKIMIPKTKEAAKYYGRGTRWCTAGDKDNRFKYYSRRGPLYDIIFRGSGVKWQFHFESAQFMDERDERLSPKQVITVYNLFSEDKWMTAVKHEGLAIRYVQNPSDALQMIAVKQNGKAIRFIKNPSEEAQIAAVKQDGRTIEYIKNPSEAVKMAAVQENGYVIQYINNPSEEVKMAAVKRAGLAIRYINNPSDALQMIAVKQNGKAIRFIKNPSEEAQIAAVKQDGWAIQYINNPSEAMQMTAVKQDGRTIEYIKNPSEAVKMAAVKQDGRAIQYIKNPSEKMQMVAVKKDGWVIHYIKNPSEEVKMAAVQQNGRMIQYIKNPSEEVQMAAVQETGYAIRYIKNPSEEVQMAAVKKDGWVIRYINNPSEEVKMAAERNK